MPSFPLALDPDSTDLAPIVNAPVLWLTVVAVFGVIIAQSVIYYVAVRKAAPAVGMSRKEVATSFRAGAVASIGPSLAVALIALTLITVFGTPAALVRIGLIGSAAFEVGGAAISANAQGAELGGEGYTQSVFASVLLSLSLAGTVWMLVTLIATPLLKRGANRLEGRTVGRAAGAMSIIPGAALLGAFATLGMQQVQRGLGATLVVATTAAVMAIALWIARRFSQNWLREWGLGIAVVIGLVVAVLINAAGIA
ncbi:DUF5058 family protein [Microbacterium sp. No. 7]|uniref:DUF5058 family protein n=1 Tax=Microbacterium sp. No. 7 TaxID=1714373 RepID=UPI0006CFA0D3|nr:DUF5058 family protein [Microbacterium sp. No. 7]ALJ19902.1 hypothetical protein AOA12_08280 [Microbacterium sp. No. 7]